MPIGDIYSSFIVKINWIPENAKILFIFYGQTEHKVIASDGSLWTNTSKTGTFVPFKSCDTIHTLLCDGTFAIDIGPQTTNIVARPQVYTPYIVIQGAGTTESRTLICMYSYLIHFVVN